jgi:hypothetical protein
LSTTPFHTQEFWSKGGTALGTDIHGWVEYWDPVPEEWTGVIKLDRLLGDRNYEIYAWLFGVRRRPDIPMRWDFQPIAAQRGLPLDASRESVEEHTRHISQYPDEFFGESWVTWSEMQAINWDEPIEDRVIARRQDEGFGGTLYWRSQFVQKYAAILPGGVEALRPGQQWTAGGIAYEVAAMRRRDVLEDDWELLFCWMRALADRRGGGSNVRLVAWFDG